MNAIVNRNNLPLLETEYQTTCKTPTRFRLIFVFLRFLRISSKKRTTWYQGADISTALEKMVHNNAITEMRLRQSSEIKGWKENCVPCRNAPNKPFPSSCLPPLQSESQCEVFVMVISSTLNKNENYFS